MVAIEHYRTIPHGVLPESVRAALTTGLGYSWLLLSNQTKEQYYGDTTDSHLPRIRMIGKQIVIELYDEEYLDQLDRILSSLKSFRRDM